MDQETAQPGTFEERRLALEFERLRLERQKASIELLLKRREANVPRNRGWKDIFANPLTLAIVGGFITLMTTTITGHFSSSQNIAAETAKAREALQADLIKKFVENPNPETVRANLKFLVDVGLVPGYAANLRTFLDKNPNSALPSSFIPGTSALQNVHTDDDAIDLVMRFEGGFVTNSADPAGAMNFGITVAALSNYLGKPASKDDLRNLSVETARDVYKKLYLTGGAPNLASEQVKAAYLSIATSVGPNRAGKIFAAAIGKIDNHPVTDEDGALGADIVKRINATDPDLLIETANCGAARYYQSLPQAKLFIAAWMRRLRTFSPATLKGLCPELQASSGIGGTTPSNP